MSYNRPDMAKKVLVAMSGGVDSSVTAHLLQQAGYEVEGIHMELTEKPDGAPEPDHRELEETCRRLGVPLHYFHTEADFKERVIEYFCEEYRQGRTPNPCVRCNKNIKFGKLLERVRGMGGDYLATGHYARIEASAEGYRLLKGTDPTKDQSYFLYVLGQRELGSVLFPVGGMLKSEVKKIAAKLNLPAAVRKESQDICFIPDGNIKEFLRRRSTNARNNSGNIVDINGNIRGKHNGLEYYTVGQRQGMGIGGGERLYVIRLDKENNQLIIGSEDQLYKKRLIAHNLNWISGKAGEMSGKVNWTSGKTDEVFGKADSISGETSSESGRAPEGQTEVTARVRYRAAEAKAVLEVEGDVVTVTFAEPQRAIAPGQSVVFYRGDEVMGGGIIKETE
jgi:tRNA-uridine 2-sulfurtransferase